MVGIILASHGEFAAGILQSGAMIFGQQENVVAVTLMPDEGPIDIRSKMEQAIANFTDCDSILFLVDLWGGTPFNQARSLLTDHEETWAIVSGLNLPMLIEAYGARLSMSSAHEIASNIVQTAIDGVKILPDILVKDKKSEETVSEQTTTIPEGTVVGDGQIKIPLARIDSRLLHGQVATAWTKAVNPTRIIVVSDNVARDELRKSLITQAAPPGVKANVIPINKMIEIWNDPRFGGTSALLLFENPQDVVKVIDAGVELPEINIGSMAHSEGKKMINNVLSVNEADIAAFKHMRDLGIKFDVRKVPNDSRGDIFDLLNKADLV